MIVDAVALYILVTIFFFGFSWPFIDDKFEEPKKKLAVMGALFFWPITLPAFGLFCAAAGVLVMCEWVIDQIMPT